jgi:hypothetical protein
MVKLFQYSKTKPCYYCGSTVSSYKEHVPAQTVFSGFDCDSITVPGCEQHNGKRSRDDQSVVTALAMTAHKTHRAFPDSRRLTPNVIKAIRITQPHFSQAKQDVELRQLLAEPMSDLDTTLPYIRSQRIMTTWMQQLTAGLVWSVLGEHSSPDVWDRAIVESPDFVCMDERLPNEAVLELLQANAQRRQHWDSMTWFCGWSAHPRRYPVDIYRFDVCFGNSSSIVFRHSFYNDIVRWYVRFAASETMSTAIGRVVPLVAPRRGPY